VNSYAQPKETRVALVIGNGSYKASPLRNPVNDAKDMATKLRSLGFTVVERNNLTVKQIGSTLREFRGKLVPGSVALVFYAGHGIQIKGENYLPAVDAEIAGEEDVPNQSLAIRQVMDILSDAKTRLNLVFLDACRNNPYARSFRSTGDGLSRVVAPSGTLISFATRPGSVASDGDGKNGLYTGALLAAMDNTNQSIEQVLKQVVGAVKNASKSQQEPWMEGSIEGEFCFGKCLVVALAGNTVSDDRAFWESVKDSNNVSELEAYLEKFPNGLFSGLAKVRVDSFKKASSNTQAALPSAPASSSNSVAIKEKDEGLCSSQVKPEMPLEAVYDEIGGTVKVQITIADGSVKDVRSLDGPKIFESAVKKVVSQYKCKSGTNATVTQEFNFLVGGQKGGDGPRTETEYLQRLKQLKGIVVDCPDCPQMVNLRSGSFLIGSNDQLRNQPIKSVNVPAFLIGKTEVTQRQWKAVMGTYFNLTDCGFECPVSNISWKDAQDFARRISEITGKRYRLPSEAEWEYAAKAGSNTKWGFGDDENLLNTHAWFHSNGEGKEHPVAQKIPNTFGLYDMHGNVWEWVQDCWHDTYDGAPSDGSAWMIGCKGAMKVFRGGNWKYVAGETSSSHRNANSPESRYVGSGFRLVRDL